MADITKTSEKELQKQLQEKRIALRDIRFGVAGSKARNVHESRLISRDVARILTELNARLRKTA
ncbi:50S ribosomal protein L29 [Candidatus Wolfebacteria bacterium]|nr:MAG: 50S ribosomal protein L29 [Candidatus Wolfebacteria bacterium]